MVLSLLWYILPLSHCIFDALFKIELCCTLLPPCLLHFYVKQSVVSDRNAYYFSLVNFMLLCHVVRCWYQCSWMLTFCFFFDVYVLVKNNFPSCNKMILWGFMLNYLLFLVFLSDDMEFHVKQTQLIMEALTYKWSKTSWHIICFVRQIATLGMTNRKAKGICP